MWLHQDFRMEGANGDFIKRWATLPFLISQPTLPGVESENWRQAEPYGLGYKFLFHSGNEPAQLLGQGRAMSVLLGLAAGGLVFFCAKKIFGALGGLLALALFVFSPDMLAFGGIVSTEMSVCLMLLGSTWCIWRLLHRITWGRLLASLGFLSMLFLAKATALVIFPITAVLVVVRLFSKEPLVWQLGQTRMINSRVAQMGLFLGLFLVHGVWCWLCLWAQYDFRYSSSPDTSNQAIGAWVHTSKSPVDPTLAAVVAWGRRTHVLPEGYLDGIALLLSENQMRETFMNGTWSLGRTPAFFPYAVWAKTPPALWLLIILGLAALLGRWIQNFQKQAARTAWANFARVYYEAIPLVVLVLVFVAVVQAQNLNIAHRHILPIYPPIDILAGGTLGLIWLKHQRTIKAMIALLFIWYVGDSLAIYPNYLAYFSPSVGGPAHGYQRLSESSIDWGMDLPGLKQWLKRNDPNDKVPFYLSYFGTDNPDYYGIKSTRLPSFPAWEAEGVYDMRSGYYAISATLFQSFYIDTQGPWNAVYEATYQKCRKYLALFDATTNSPQQRAALLKKYPEAFWLQTYSNFKKLRFSRLCAWLRHHRRPDDNVGHSILIWKLDQSEIDDALVGKPAEMAKGLI
jgi:4-amino-4-deoxy-L-arabinose transferase-like glycosyltransferase